MSEQHLSPEQLRRLEARQARQAREVSRDEVLRRNSVERIKSEKHPFALEQEFQALGQTPYEEIKEEDILRLQWFGMYHDKPKTGDFMMRVKIPNGLLSPKGLRTIGELSVRFGNNRGEITTRQDIQLHHIRLAMLPEVFPALAGAGLSTKGGCGDILRNITGCPVAGVSRDELFDTTALVMEAHRRVMADPTLSDLPRKHKWTISACPFHCNAPEIHDVALVGTMQEGQPGFAVWVGGGLSVMPRIAKPLGAFVTPGEAVDVLITIMNVWRNDLKYRLSRAKARFKFMVDDYGPEKIRELVEEQLGRKLVDLKENPVPVGRTDHMGVHPQKQAGLYSIGVPVFPGLITGEQMIQVADIADSFSGEIRLTREQNFIVSGVPEADLERVQEQIETRTGFSLKVNGARGRSIGCTGDPLCNYAVGETKRKLVEVVEHLESRFGQQIADLHFHLDGCPHACGQHWVGDIGMQGTTLSTPEGKIQAYDILLRGALGPQAQIGKAVLRRVATHDLKEYVERLVRAYIEGRHPQETIQGFFQRHTDEGLAAIAKGEALAA